MRTRGKDSIPIVTFPRRRRLGVALLTVWLFNGAISDTQPRSSGPPLVKESAAVKVSDYVFVIFDANVRFVPNVGIVVGDTATLVVDTGLGPRNGQTIVREVAKVSRNTDLYVVSTHFHPEHAGGEMAFPERATIVRAQAQQRDIDELGQDFVSRFSTFTPVMEELLQGVVFPAADMIFERDHTLDLGGLRVRVMARGPTHTRGDTMVFVEDDGVLLAGDVVMNKAFLAFNSPSSSVDTWLASLDELSLLRPDHVVPSHGRMGDASLIAAQRGYLQTVRNRVRELKRAGRTADETAELVGRELQARYPTWTSPTRVVAAARAAYREAPQ